MEASSPSTEAIVRNFTEKLAVRLNPDMLDGPVRLDNTHTVVIIPVKNHGRIHAHLNSGVSDEEVANVIKQIATVPSLVGLVKEA